MDYDIVVATRNRAQTLKLSIPLFLTQTRLPKRLIIVDSSDDHSEVLKVLSTILEASSSVETIILASARGLTLQRNLGMSKSSSPVIMFPDDDSLWFPDTAEQLMQIYEKDELHQIGAVAALSVHEAPGQAALEISQKLSSNGTFRNRIRQTARRLITGVTENVFVDPLHPEDHWMKIWGARPIPQWLQNQNAQPCCTFAGFRMSFRSDVIKQLGGFDERLTNYGLYEDQDATLGSLETHCNVLARSARVFHYSAPGGRYGGFENGVTTVLNRTYIICKRAAPSSRARQLLRAYFRYKFIVCASRAYTSYGRDRFLGLCRALPRVNELMAAPPEELGATYTSIRDEIMSSRPPR